MQTSLSDFKTILQIVKEQNIALKIKTHTDWSSDYLQIIGFIASTSDKMNKTFGGIVLSNINETEGVIINNISTVTAFELEQDLGNYIAKTVYNLIDNSFVLKDAIPHKAKSTT